MTRCSTCNAPTMASGCPRCDREWEPVRFHIPAGLTADEVRAVISEWAPGMPAPAADQIVDLYFSEAA